MVDSEFLKKLSDSELAALIIHADEIRAILHELAIIDGVEFELPLDVSDPFAVYKLFEEGLYRGTVEDRICELPGPICVHGVRNVRYRIVDGEQLKRQDGNVYRLDVEQWFEKNHMHPADLAEALLPPARFRLLGKGGSLVTFLKDQSWGLLIERNEDDGMRHAMIRAYRHWPSRFKYLGVCEAGVSTDK